MSRTPGITEVHRLENIQTSIRTRPQLVPSFTDLSARDKLTFSSIEKDAALKIKVVEAKVSIAQVRAIRRGTTLINSRDIEKSKKSEISAIQKSATEKKQALFANVKPVFAETDRSFTETELHAIFDRFAQKLTSIEKERTANIQRTENKAGIAQSLTARAPRPRIAIIVTIDKKRNLAVSEIEKTATHQKNILFLQAKQELLAHQQTYFESLFETYSNELSSSPEGTPTLENLKQCQQIVRQTFDAEQKVFSALGDLEQASEPAIAAAINTVALADTARMRALHPFVEHSINT
ncbi:MAG: hypothetical protein WCO92_04665 [Verrucomicrobiota bacterium]